jgi:hypothetical protein
MVILPTSETGVRAGLALSFVFLLPFSLMRRDRDGMQQGLLILGSMGGQLILELWEFCVDKGVAGEVTDN